MWRILLSLITHRFFLVVVALSAFYLKSSQSSISDLWSQLLEKVGASPEVNMITTQLESAKDPFIYLGKLICTVSSIEPTIVVLILSNIFLFLFLRELFLFVNNLALPDVAVNTCILSILWLTSYELSFGSSLSLSCFLSVLILRTANDNRWLLTGIAIGLLALTKPFSVFLIPLLLVFIWNQNKYAVPGETAKKLVYLVLPISASLFLSRSLYKDLGSIIADSAFLNLLSAFKLQGDFSWTLSASYLG